MKSIFFFLFFTVCAGASAFAQADDSTVTVTTITDAVYTGKIIEEAKGRYIRLQEANGQVSRIAFNTITQITNAKGEKVYVKQEVAAPDIVITEPTTIKTAKNTGGPPDKLFTDLPAYRGWLKAFMVRDNDTTYFRIDAWDDYSSPQSGMSYKGVRIAYHNGTEARLKCNLIYELVVFNGLSQNISLLPGYSYSLFRVLVDGKCQLLYSQEEKSGAPMMGPNGMIMGSGESFMKENWDIYYKGQYWHIRSESDNLLGSRTVPNFKAKCRQIFAECPAVLEKVEQKTYTAKDLDAMVEEFNECLAGK